MDRDELVALTAEIVAAHVSYNSTSIRDIEGLIQSVHASLGGLGTAPPEASLPKTPMVSARASITPDHLICVACGERLKVLRRHLRVVHGIAPDEYRRTYRLPWAYPMTAPNYSRVRADLARASGLGRRERTTPKAAKGSASGAAKAPARKKRTAKPKA